MINPIQQNVVFKGNEAIEETGRFTGSMPVAENKTDVRGSYSNAVSSVLNLQQSANRQTDLTAGNKLNISA